MAKNVSCEYCRVSCTSILSLSEHVGGQKHRAALLRCEPSEAKQLGRLHYFLEKYLKNQPLLGLEEVLENKVGHCYVYTCNLCNKELRWKEMVAHIIDIEHGESYVNKHHSELISKIRSHPKADQPQVLKAAIRRIQASVVRKKDPENRPSAIADLPQNSVKPKKGSNPTTVPQGRDSDLSDVRSYDCSLCDVSCSSPMILCSHVLGNKHKKKLRLTAPKQLKEMGRLGYFLHNHIKNEPILGLEYIVETGPDPVYKFSCQLCDMDADLQQIVGHITDVYHTVHYITRHHKDMLAGLEMTSRKPGYLNALRAVAVTILERYGRKAIQVKHTTGGGPAKAELLREGDGKRREASKDGNAPPSKHDGGSSCPSKKKQKKSNLDGLPLAKRGRFCPEGDQGTLPSRPHTSKYGGSSYNERLDVTTAEQESEFRINDQFFEYLANFSIKDDEDVVLIQKIIQNCIKALTSFQEEEGKLSSHQAEAPLTHTSRTNQPDPPLAHGYRTHQPETSLVHTSRTDQEILDISVPTTSLYISVPKIESHSLGSETTLPKDTSHPSSDPISKNKITDYFFSSIKNMDESQVVGIFRKIATVNPQFQGMNIPAVIRFLKDSGRLK